MSRRHRTREEIWIVLRADLFHGPETNLETLITVKAAFRTRERAEQEVDRLNALHPDGRVRYWSALGRLFGDGDEPEVV